MEQRVERPDNQLELETLIAEGQWTEVVKRYKLVPRCFLTATDFRDEIVDCFMESDQGPVDCLFYFISNLNWANENGLTLMDRLNLLVLIHQLVITSQQDSSNLLKIAVEHAFRAEHAAGVVLPLDDEEISTCLQASVEMCIFDSSVAILEHSQWTAADQQHLPDDEREGRLSAMRLVLKEVLSIAEEESCEGLLQLCCAMLVGLLKNNGRDESEREAFVSLLNLCSRSNELHLMLIDKLMDLALLEEYSFINPPLEILRKVLSDMCNDEVLGMRDDVMQLCTKVIEVGRRYNLYPPGVFMPEVAADTNVCCLVLWKCLSDPELLAILYQVFDVLQKGDAFVHHRLGIVVGEPPAALVEVFGNSNNKPNSTEMREHLQGLLDSFFSRSLKLCSLSGKKWEFEVEAAGLDRYLRHLRGQSAQQVAVTSGTVDAAHMSSDGAPQDSKSSNDVLGGESSYGEGTSSIVYDDNVHSAVAEEQQVVNPNGAVFNALATEANVQQLFGSWMRQINEIMPSGSDHDVNGSINLQQVHGSQQYTDHEGNVARYQGNGHYERYGYVEATDYASNINSDSSRHEVRAKYLINEVSAGRNIAQEQYGYSGMYGNDKGAYTGDGRVECSEQYYDAGDDVSPSPGKYTSHHNSCSTSQTNAKSAIENQLSIFLSSERQNADMSDLISNYERSINRGNNDPHSNSYERDYQATHYEVPRRAVAQDYWSQESRRDEHRHERRKKPSDGERIITLVKERLSDSGESSRRHSEHSDRELRSSLSSRSMQERVVRRIPVDQETEFDFRRSCWERENSRECDLSDCDTEEGEVRAADSSHFASNSERTITLVQVDSPATERSKNAMPLSSDLDVSAMQSLDLNSKNDAAWMETAEDTHREALQHDEVMSAERLESLEYDRRSPTPYENEEIIRYWRAFGNRNDSRSYDDNASYKARRSTSIDRMKLGSHERSAFVGTRKRSPGCWQRRNRLADTSHLGREMGRSRERSSSIGRIGKARKRSRSISRTRSRDRSGSLGRTRSRNRSRSIGRTRSRDRSGSVGRTRSRGRSRSVGRVKRMRDRSGSAGQVKRLRRQSTSVGNARRSRERSRSAGRTRKFPVRPLSIGRRSRERSGSIGRRRKASNERRRSRDRSRSVGRRKRSRGRSRSAGRTRVKSRERSSSAGKLSSQARQGLIDRERIRSGDRRRSADRKLSLERNRIMQLDAAKQASEKQPIKEATRHNDVQVPVQNISRVSPCEAPKEKMEAVRLVENVKRRDDSPAKGTVEKIFITEPTSSRAGDETDVKRALQNKVLKNNARLKELEEELARTERSRQKRVADDSESSAVKRPRSDVDRLASQCEIQPEGELEELNVNSALLHTNNNSNVYPVHRVKANNRSQQASNLITIPIVNSTESAAQEMVVSSEVSQVKRATMPVLAKTTVPEQLTEGVFSTTKIEKNSTATLSASTSVVSSSISTLAANASSKKFVPASVSLSASTSAASKSTSAGGSSYKSVSAVNGSSTTETLVRSPVQSRMPLVQSSMPHTHAVQQIFPRTLMQPGVHPVVQSNFTNVLAMQQQMVMNMLNIPMGLSMPQRIPTMLQQAIHLPPVPPRQPILPLLQTSHIRLPPMPPPVRQPVRSQSVKMLPNVVSAQETQPIVSPLSASSSSLPQSQSKVSQMQPSLSQATAVPNKASDPQGDVHVTNTSVSGAHYVSRLNDADTISSSELTTIRQVARLGENESPVDLVKQLAVAKKWTEVAAKWTSMLRLSNVLWSKICKHVLEALLSLNNKLACVDSVQLVIQYAVTFYNIRRPGGDHCNRLRNNILTLARLAVDYFQQLCRWCDIYRVLNTLCVEANIASTVFRLPMRIDTVKNTILSYIGEQNILAAFQTMINSGMVAKGQKSLVFNLYSRTCPNSGQLLQSDSAACISEQHGVKYEIFIRFLLGAIDYVVTKPSETIFVMAVRILQCFMRLLEPYGHEYIVSSALFSKLLSAMIGYAAPQTIDAMFYMLRSNLIIVDCAVMRRLVIYYGQRAYNEPASETSKAFEALSIAIAYNIYLQPQIFESKPKVERGRSLVGEVELWPELDEKEAFLLISLCLLRVSVWMKTIEQHYLRIRVVTRPSQPSVDFAYNNVNDTCDTAIVTFRQMIASHFPPTFVDQHHNLIDIKLKDWLSRKNSIAAHTKAFRSRQKSLNKKMRARENSIVGQEKPVSVSQSTAGVSPQVAADNPKTSGVGCVLQAETSRIGLVLPLGKRAAVASQPVSSSTSTIAATMIAQVASCTVSSTSAASNTLHVTSNKPTEAAALGSSSIPSTTTAEAANMCVSTSAATSNTTAATIAPTVAAATVATCAETSTVAATTRAGTSTVAATTRAGTSTVAATTRAGTSTVAATTRAGTSTVAATTRAGTSTASGATRAGTSAISATPSAVECASASICAVTSTSAITHAVIFTAAPGASSVSSMSAAVVSTSAVMQGLSATTSDTSPMPTTLDAMKATMCAVTTIPANMQTVISALAVTQTMTSTSASSQTVAFTSAAVTSSSTASTTTCASVSPSAATRAVTTISASTHVVTSSSTTTPAMTRTAISASATTHAVTSTSGSTRVMPAAASAQPSTSKTVVPSNSVSTAGSLHPSSSATKVPFIANPLSVESSRSATSSAGTGTAGIATTVTSSSSTAVRLNKSSFSNSRQQYGSNELRSALPPSAGHNFKASISSESNFVGNNNMARMINETRRGSFGTFPRNAIIGYAGLLPTPDTAEFHDTDLRYNSANQLYQNELFEQRSSDVEIMLEDVDLRRTTNDYNRFEAVPQRGRYDTEIEPSFRSRDFDFRAHGDYRMVRDDDQYRNYNLEHFYDAERQNRLSAQSGHLVVEAKPDAWMARQLSNDTQLEFFSHPSMEEDTLTVGDEEPNFGQSPMYFGNMRQAQYSQENNQSWRSLLPAPEQLESRLNMEYRSGENRSVRVRGSHQQQHRFRGNRSNVFDRIGSRPHFY